MATIDARELMEKAARSEELEAFQTLGRRPGLRFGAGARAPDTYFVEVLIDLFPDGQVDLVAIENALVLLRWLYARGYRLSCWDDRTVCGELTVPLEKVEKEVAALRQQAGAATEKRL